MSGQTVRLVVAHILAACVLFHHSAVPVASQSFPNEEGVRTTVITRRVPVPYLVQVERKVPYPIRVPVRRPFAVYVPKPYIVEVPKPSPYAVKVPIPSPYAVEKQVPVPYKVTYDRPYPVQVPKPYPVLIEKYTATSSPVTFSEVQAETPVKFSQSDIIKLSEPGNALPLSLDHKVNAYTDSWTEASSDPKHNSSISYPDIYEKGKGMFVSPSLNTNKIHPDYRLMFDPVKKEYFLEYAPAATQARPETPPRSSDFPENQKRYPNNNNLQHPVHYEQKPSDWPQESVQNPGGSLSSFGSGPKELTLKEVVSKLKFLNSNNKENVKEISQGPNSYQTLVNPTRHLMKANYRFNKPLVQSYGAEQSNLNYQFEQPNSNYHYSEPQKLIQEASPLNPGYQYAATSHHPSYLSDPAISHFSKENVVTPAQRMPFILNSYSQENFNAENDAQYRHNDSSLQVAPIQQTRHYYAYEPPGPDRKEAQFSSVQQALDSHPIHVVQPTSSNEPLSYTRHEVTTRNPESVTPHSETFKYEPRIVYVPYPVYTTNASHASPHYQPETAFHYTTPEPPVPHYRYQYNSLNYEKTTPMNPSSQFQPSRQQDPMTQIELVTPPNLTESAITDRSDINDKKESRSKNKRDRHRHRKNAARHSSTTYSPLGDYRSTTGHTDAEQSMNRYQPTDFLKLPDVHPEDEATSEKYNVQRKKRGQA